MSIVVGYVAAASRAGLARTSLRRLVAKGQLPARKGPEGTWTFEAEDLDALRAARASTAIAPTVAIPGASTAVAAGGTVPTGEIPAFLLRAVEVREDAGVDDEIDGDGAAEYGQTAHQREPPFWASAATTPTYPDGEPYVDVATGRICYRQVPTSTAPHAPGTPAAVVQQLQAQLVELQSQLDAARVEHGRWRSAWRAERVGALAGQEALQAVRTGVPAEVAQAVVAGVSHALSALSDEQLGDDQLVFAAARAAGVHAAHAAGAWAASAWAPGARDREDDVARARARRRQRRW